MSFARGDRVRVQDHVPANRDSGGCYWVLSMDEFCGRVGEVERVEVDYCRVRFGEGNYNSWCFGNQHLTLVEPATEQSEGAMRVGTTIRFLNSRPPDADREPVRWEPLWDRYLGSFGVITDICDGRLADYYRIRCDDGRSRSFYKTWFTTSPDPYPYANLKAGDKVTVVDKAPQQHDGYYYNWDGTHQGQTGVVKETSQVYRAARVSFACCNAWYHYLWLKPPVLIPFYAVVLGPREAPTSIPEVFKDAAAASARAAELGGEAVDLATLGSIA